MWFRAGRLMPWALTQILSPVLSLRTTSLQDGKMLTFKNSGKNKKCKAQAALGRK